MYHWLRTPLFLLNPELAHELAMKGLDTALASDATWRSTWELLFVGGDAEPKLQREVFGLTFPNPVGLGAGFDKNAKHLRALSAMGFGFIEIGTITGQPQPGNPRPRIFRLQKDEGLMNRMGFNNEGAEAVARRLDSTLSRLPSPRPVLGINIGKTKIVSNEEAVADYIFSMRNLHEFADYMVVNVSSPNTPGLRALQDKEPLLELLSALQEENQALASRLRGKPRPLLLKIAPDLELGALEDIVEVVHQTELAGIIATNTTISREGLLTDTSTLGSGGVSGAPVRARALQVVETLREMTQLPIIGVGGVFEGEHAVKMLQAGANLVQVWTGFVYEGPRMVRRINEVLLDSI